MSRPITLRLPSWVDALDESIDDLWEPLRRSPAANRVFYTASTVGDFSAIWHAINVLRLTTGRIDRHEAIRNAAALGLDSILLNQGVKRAFERARPDHDGERPHHLRQPSTSSFPSGHASSATVAASLMAGSGLPGATIRLVAATVAASRLHVRIHHASDVVAGSAFGWAFVKAFEKVWVRR